ncbi:MAG: NADH-dependent flavin oxidoreductase, partial [Chromatiales bacterium]|nr:NADH-dependent flavin oxidoreductase [Chromatiales bacterium]
MAHSTFPSVFEPLRLGRMTLENRIFVPGHTTNYGVDHLPSKRHVNYHVERARGGVGMIIFESIRVHPHSLGRPQAVGGYDSACIPPFRQLTDAVHREGVPILGQVIHLGRQIPGEFERAVAWGPSSIRWSASAAMPHAMYADEIEEVIAAHVTTARNVVEAGFDGFEVHLGHGHLLQQFLSPSSNQRDDAFGGDEERRLTFPLAVLRAVRDAVGPDVCMGVRISGEEFIDDGLHLDEMCRQMGRIAAQVQLDFVNTSHSAYHGSYSLATQMADMAFDPSMFRHIPKIIGESLRAAGHSMPILSVCKYRTLAEAEEMLVAGHTDMVGMARAHMADPALVNKSRDGLADEVIPCIACNQGCAGNLQKDLALTCIANPRMGLEGRWPRPEDASTDSPKRI